MLSKNAQMNHALGALLGLAVGDATGTTHEFRQLEAPPFPSLALGPLRGPIGGGPFEVAPGEVTDDTHMACCLEANLQEFDFYPANLVVESYAQWMDLAFDIGQQTRASLSAYLNGYGPLEAGFRVWENSKCQAAGNGSLMRTAPIGVHFAEDHEGRRRASLMDSSLTHADPRCSLACAAFNAAVSLAVKGSTSPLEMLAAAAAELPLAADHLIRVFPEMAPQDIPSLSAPFWNAWPGRVQDALADLQKDLEAAQQATPGLDQPTLHLQEHQGFVRVAFRLAFWQLLHRTSFEEGLLDTVNRGGDADTNGAITGALLGAYYGAEAIPPAWRDIVLNCVPRRMPPSTTAYHPRVFMRLSQA